MLRSTSTKPMSSSWVSAKPLLLIFSGAAAGLVRVRCRRPDGSSAPQGALGMHRSSAHARSTTPGRHHAEAIAGAKSRVDVDANPPVSARAATPRAAPRSMARDDNALFHPSKRRHARSSNRRIGQIAHPSKRDDSDASPASERMRASRRESSSCARAWSSATPNAPQAMAAAGGARIFSPGMAPGTCEPGSTGLFPSFKPGGNGECGRFR